MSKRDYLSDVALKELLADKFVHGFFKKLYQQKPYWQIFWRGEANPVLTAVAATDYGGDSSERVPFGVQDELLRLGKVAEVLLVYQKWSYYYRIPAAEFRQIKMTEDDGRRIFQVNSSGELCSRETDIPVNLAKFQKKR